MSERIDLTNPKDASVGSCIILILILLFIWIILPVPRTIKGTVEKVETVSVIKSLLGDTFLKKVKFKGKEPILLQDSKSNTQIEEGRIYEVEFFPNWITKKIRIMLLSGFLNMAMQKR
ncbi:MAG: hypothetical protein COZ28_00410 [Candidatus Moranbacteria bacterium CG_4_10_14_3_um_filter_44_15]|nr:MAG: hypothetical protein COZ87_02425 [Candidatus Moranbacteria bacterium CG_4_8_14_3_um_filter_43_15]PIX91143.1 MAG: hypothetical protein COZ28_00410 [Candidatus Moranbacteria bacterium CG_4_10_14_3_um_filter_44_15]PJA86202.1 MAG: hypothetical protein CO142_01420 [Candidatus Moranbacteria bacterium CG_4_9_14_3_um_filter_44_28]